MKCLKYRKNIQQRLTPGSCVPRVSIQHWGCWRVTGRCSEAQWAGGRSKAGGRGRSKQLARSSEPAGSEGGACYGSPSSSARGALTAAARARITIKLTTLATLTLLLLLFHIIIYIFFKVTTFIEKLKTSLAVLWKWINNGQKQLHNPLKITFICSSDDPRLALSFVGDSITICI